MDYTLYITENCPGCRRVLDRMAADEINIEVRDVSDGMDGGQNAPSLVPALYLGNKLLAYGDEITVVLRHRFAS